MEFQHFANKLANNVSKITRGQTHLFVTGVNPDDLWNLYLDSFPEGMNPIFRERREYDCSCCRQFIRSFGNVVAIENNQVISIWDFDIADAGYQVVIDALSAFVKSEPVQDVFVSPTRKFGLKKNVEVREDASLLTWYHYYATVADSVEVVAQDALASVRGRLRESRQVLERSLTEISLEAVETVLELIAQKSLYRGEEWCDALKAFRKVHKAYGDFPKNERANFCWTTSLKNAAISRSC